MAEATFAGPLRPVQVGLRADTDDAALLQRLGAVLGAPLPLRPGTVSTGEGRRVLWLGPDEWLAVDERGTGPELASALEDAAGAGFATAVDLSSNRVVFVLAGSDARAVLAGAIAVDLHPRAFADRTCAQTLLARSQVVLERDGESFRLYVRPSFAPYVEGWLEDGISRPKATRTSR